MYDMVVLVYSEILFFLFDRGVFSSFLMFFIICNSFRLQYIFLVFISLGSMEKVIGVRVFDVKLQVTVRVIKVVGV